MDISDQHIHLDYNRRLLKNQWLKKSISKQCTRSALTVDTWAIGTIITCEKSVDHHTTRPTIKAPKTEAGKRTVPLLNALATVLIMPAGAKPADCVFNLNGALLTRSAFRHRWIDYCRQTGLVTEIKRKEKHKKKDIEFQRTVYQPTLAAHLLRH